jgi:hypothetical protein
MSHSHERAWEGEKRRADLNLQQDGCHMPQGAHPSAFTLNSLPAFSTGRTVSDELRTVSCSKIGTQEAGGLQKPPASRAVTPVISKDYWGPNLWRYSAEFKKPLILVR